MALGLQHIYFNLSKIYAIIYIGNPISESMKGENRMYLTVKQQVKTSVQGRLHHNQGTLSYG